MRNKVKVGIIHLGLTETASNNYVVKNSVPFFSVTWIKHRLQLFFVPFRLQRSVENVA